jgi:hypothetical protein
VTAPSGPEDTTSSSGPASEPPPNTGPNGSGQQPPSTGSGESGPPPASAAPSGPSAPPTDNGPVGHGGPPGGHGGPPSGPPGGPPGGTPSGPPGSGPGHHQPWHGRSPALPTQSDLQFPDYTDDTEPACNGQQLPGDAPPPPPFQYHGQTVSPVFDSNLGQWGFWSQKKWTPLDESAC